MYNSLLKSAANYLVNLYQDAGNIAQRFSHSLIPNSGLQLAVEGAPVRYGGGNENYPNLFFSKGKSRHRLKPKDLQRERNRVPSYEGPIRLIAEGIHWRGVKDPYEMAALIVEASNLDRGNPLYRLTEQPSSEEKRWAKDILSNPQTLEEIAISNGETPTA